MTKQELTESMADFLGWEDDGPLAYAHNTDWNHPTINTRAGLITKSGAETFFFIPDGFFAVLGAVKKRFKDRVLYIDLRIFPAMVGCTIDRYDRAQGDDLYTAFYEAVHAMKEANETSKA